MLSEVVVNANGFNLFTGKLLSFLELLKTDISSEQAKGEWF